MPVEQIGVAGAGTMGAGIAQLACLGGYRTILHDPQPEALEKGVAKLRADLARGAEKGRWSSAEAEAAAARIGTAGALEGLGECDLVVEAAPESLELKRSLFAGLEGACNQSAVLATNTSSLPVAEVAAVTSHPERICGMHFFNPPALMKLVEVVAAERTSEAAIATTIEVAERMGRTAVRCTDSPGFIVNRCNRPYALESLRMLELEVASAAEIDAVMRECGGYRMGPFELIDLIGVDVNLEVARSFYRQRKISRWQPSPISERLVAEGKLGRKSGVGFYVYREGSERGPVALPAPELSEAILNRIVAALVNEACFAVGEGVCSADDVDTAMQLGLNHPRGPFEWGRELGPEAVLAILDRLAADTGDERYGAAPLLRGWAAGGSLTAAAPR